MRPCDVILAFWLSCVQFFDYVDSQSCTSGWFGSNCKYKCRCEMDSCDTNGQCTGSNICQGGWFGPRCQYVDLLYNTTAVANKIEATDGLDSTCVSPTGITTININLTEPIYFSWMRVVVTQLGSDHLINSLVTFYLDSTQIPCPEIHRFLLGTSILDVQCNLTQKINQVTLEGGSVDHLCSVYISGGRNVALKEYTNQTSTFSYNVRFSSDLSVDGNTNPYSYTGYSCSSTYTQSATNRPKWTIIFSRPRHVYKYVIYNRREQPEALIGAQVLSYSQPNNLVFHHTDNATLAKPLFTAWHNTPIVSIVTVTVKVENTHNWLAMCEVEIYGDSICDAFHYGLECEQPCNCPYGEACFMATGQCPECPFGFEGKGCLSECNVSFGFHCNSPCSQRCKGPCHRVTGNCITCKSGFIGPVCDSECPVGRFGDGCNSSCSVNCEAPDNATMSPCDHVAGKCFTACMPGYAPPTCEHECPVGRFGDGCNSSCSVNCEAPDNATMSPCDRLAGKCFTGCKPGYTPPKCEHAAHSTGFGLEAIIGLCFLAAIALFGGFCLTRRKKKAPLDETRHESAQPEN